MNTTFLSYLKGGLIALWAGLFLGGCEKKPTSTSEILRVATCADYPPYEFFYEGKLTGFDIDLIEEIGRKLGKKVEIKDMPFDSLLGALQTGRVDMVISSLYETPERKESVDFSQEYYNGGNRALVCFDHSSLKDINDLQGKTVGVQSGSAYEKYAQEELLKSIPDLKIVSLSRIPDLIQDMKANRSIGIIMGKVEALTLLRTQKGFKIIPLTGEVPGLSIALPKNSSLTSQVNKAIFNLNQEGFIQTLAKKWIQSEEEKRL